MFDREKHLYGIAGTDAEDVWKGKRKGHIPAHKVLPSPEHEYRITDGVPASGITIEQLFGQIRQIVADEVRKALAELPGVKR